jgi:hypothetical protein
MFKMKIKLATSLLALSMIAFGQQTITPANVTFSADAVIALQNWFLTQVASTPTTLAQPMTAVATTMTLVDATGLSIAQEFVVDNEAVTPSAITGNVVTIVRADLGTAAVAHSAGTSVKVLIYRGLRNFCKQSMAAAVAQIMAQVTYPTGATQDAAIATANAAKAAAIAGAVQ